MSEPDSPSATHVVDASAANRSADRAAETVPAEAQPQAATGLEGLAGLEALGVPMDDPAVLAEIEAEFAQLAADIERINTSGGRGPGPGKDEMIAIIKAQWAERSKTDEDAPEWRHKVDGLLTNALDRILSEGFNQSETGELTFEMDANLLQEEAPPVLKALLGGVTEVLAGKFPVIGALKAQAEAETGKSDDAVATFQHILGGLGTALSSALQDAFGGMASSMQSGLDSVSRQAAEFQLRQEAAAAEAEAKAAAAAEGKAAATAPQDADVAPASDAEKTSSGAGDAVASTITKKTNTAPDAQNDQAPQAAQAAEVTSSPVASKESASKESASKESASGESASGESASTSQGAAGESAAAAAAKANASGPTKTRFSGNDINLEGVDFNGILAGLGQMFKGTVTTSPPATPIQPDPKAPEGTVRVNGPQIDIDLSGFLGSLLGGLNTKPSAKPGAKPGAKLTPPKFQSAPKSEGAATSPPVPGAPKDEPSV